MNKFLKPFGVAPRRKNSGKYHKTPQKQVKKFSGVGKKVPDTVKPEIKGKAKGLSGKSSKKSNANEDLDSVWSKDGKSDAKTRSLRKFGK